jgi:P27 family predicted phage terminase small subunit
MGYCLKYAQWLALEQEADDLLVTTARGSLMPNPAIGMANRAFALVLKTAAELGLTPSSRTRVVAAKGAESGDGFTTFQRRRQKTA